MSDFEASDFEAMDFEVGTDRTIKRPPVRGRDYKEPK